MKLSVGAKLFSIREERKLSQTEMADILGVSTSAYQRIEKNEVSVEMERLLKFSQILSIPVYEFLPETLAIHNSTANGQGGLVMGNFYYYSDASKANQELVEENKRLAYQLKASEEKVALLEEQLNFLKKLLQNRDVN